MSLKNYLSQFDDFNLLNIVGPMNPPPHSLVEPLIYIDGGTKFKDELFGYSVGDGDSSTIPLDETLNPEKDFSDLGYALNQITRPFPNIHLFGFLGGRRDHEIFNLGEVYHFLSRQHSPVTVTIDEEWYAYSSGRWDIDVFGTFSVVTFADATRVSLSGHCRYHIPKGTKVPTVTSFGLSNVGEGIVHLECDRPVFIYSPDGQLHL
ncbi:MAG: hypothetical protein KDD61_04955 [Bdellovibrionales bacterium]|nr:hypothetical protein [Bdellovibrionales bacterium]